MLHGPLNLQALNDYAYGPEWGNRWDSHFGGSSDIWWG